MNSFAGTSFVAIALLMVVVMTQHTSGLKCYECQVGTFPDGWGPPPNYPRHDDCKEGDLPDSQSKVCNQTNALDIKTKKQMNASQIAGMEGKQSNIVYSCFKSTGASGGKDGTVKGCTWRYTGDGPRQNWCEYTDVEDTGSMADCACHSDNCNGAGSQLAGALTLITVVSIGYSL